MLILSENIHEEECFLSILIKVVILCRIFVKKNKLIFIELGYELEHKLCFDGPLS